MATKEQFLSELDAQIIDLRTNLSQIGDTVKTNLDTITDLKNKRVTRLAEYLANLVPDLSDATIQKLNAQLPGIVTSSQVQMMLDGLKTTYGNQLTRLGFDPSKFESSRVELTAALEKADAQLKTIQGGVFSRLERDTAIRGLLERGYETKAYTYGWFDGQFYRDWKAGDEVVEASGYKTWAEVASQYSQWAQARKIAQDDLSTSKGALTKLAADASSYNDLQAAIRRIPDDVLEKVTTKIKGRLDSMDPLPQELIDVTTNDKLITALQNQNTSWQENRTRLSDQMTSLQKIRAQAQHSHKSEVPDNYLTKLRSNRSNPGYSPSYGSGPTVIHVHDSSSNDGFFSGLMLGEMNGYFNQQAAYDRGQRDADQPYMGSSSSRSNYRETSYQSGRNDRSGQS